MLEPDGILMQQYNKGSANKHELVENWARVFTVTRGSAESLLPASELHPPVCSAGEATGISDAMLSWTVLRPALLLLRWI